MKLPGPDHPITVAPNRNRIRVTVRDTLIAETADALTLQEADYPPVLYIPREDAALSRLALSSRLSHCPYKGEAHYYGLRLDGDFVEDAIWTYEQPYPAVAEIAGYLAFYPSKVSIVEEVPEAASTPID